MHRLNGAQYFYNQAIQLGALTEDATADNWAGVYQYLRVENCHTPDECIVFAHIITLELLKVPTFVDQPVYRSSQN